jgi:hypothetical protein
MSKEPNVFPRDGWNHILLQRAPYGVLPSTDAGCIKSEPTPVLKCTALHFQTCSIIRCIGLWRWYINITITIFNIIHRPLFYLKHDASETGFCLRPQVRPTEMGPIEALSKGPIWVGSTWTRTQYSSFFYKDRTKDNAQNCDRSTTLCQRMWITGTAFISVPGFLIL